MRYIPMKLFGVLAIVLVVSLFVHLSQPLHEGAPSGSEIPDTTPVPTLSVAEGDPIVQVAPVNPAYIEYTRNVMTGSHVVINSREEGLGYIPSPLDKSHLTGMEIKESDPSRPFFGEGTNPGSGTDTLNSPAPEGTETGSQILSSPASFDLRSLGEVSPVKDQGSCGSCWAFATYGSEESTLLPAQLYDFSENNLKNTAGFDLGPCSGGNADMSAAYLARWSGPVTEASDPYGASSTTSPSGLSPVKHPQEIYYIPARASATDNDNIKTALQAYGAVYSAFYYTSANYNAATQSYYYGGTTGSNHAIAIVGWDDAYPATKFKAAPPGNGAFIVKNSWGTSWGSSGYFYLSYYDGQIGKDNAVFTSEATTNYDRVYQYDPLGWTTSLGYGSDTAYFANVFTSAAGESLSAVSFYTPALNSNYQVSVYLNPASGPVNPAGPATTLGGTIPLPGYHTIPLTTPVTLTPGQKFSIAVRLQTPGYTYPVPVEAPFSGYSSQAVASAGQSYISSSGTTWTDLTKYYANENVAVKGFTKAGTQNPNPVPVLNSISPTSATATGPAFTLTVTGSNFVPVSVVRWNGAERTTTYVSATQLTAAIPASDIALGGTASVTVFNPAPGGGTSAPRTFTINNPAPALVSITPSSTVAGGAAFTLVVNGGNFEAGSKVRWNGADRTTSYLTPTLLNAQIPSSDIASAGTASVTVFNPAPGGGTSGTSPFTISTAPNPVPTLSGMNPVSATAGGMGFTLTVTGTNFVSGSIVRWNGADRLTTYVSPNQLAASISASDIAAAGTRSVNVFNPAPGGGTSGSLTFAISAPSNPVPTISGISPSPATAGDGAFTLIVTGTGFVPTSLVRWNGVGKTTTYVSSTQLSASIQTGDIASAGTASITVFNPAPAGGISNALALPINNPVPAISGLSPTSATAGGAGFTLTVTGTGFVTTSKIGWNGAEQATSYISATQLSAAIPASSIISPGTASITVSNPTPGGGISAARTFTISPATTFTASFTANPTSGRAPLVVTFTDTSTGNPTGWTWNFGDGTSSTQRSPTHTYTEGNRYYSVSLTVTNGASTKTITRINYIRVRTSTSSIRIS